MTCETCVYSKDNVDSVNYLYCPLQRKIVKLDDVCDEFRSVYGN